MDGACVRSQFDNLTLTSSLNADRSGVASNGLADRSMSLRSESSLKSVGNCPNLLPKSERFVRDPFRCPSSGGTESPFKLSVRDFRAPQRVRSGGLSSKELLDICNV